VSLRSQHKHSEEEVLDAFRLFDPEGTGTVPVSVFRDAMQHLAGLGDAELDSMIEEAVAISRQVRGKTGRGEARGRVLVKTFPSSACRGRSCYT